MCGRSGKDTNGSFKRLTSHLESSWCLFLRQHLKSWLSGYAECFFPDADGFKLLRLTFPLANHVTPFALQTDCDSSDGSTDNDDTHGTWAATRAEDYRISFQWLICGLRPRIWRGYLFMSAFLFKLWVFNVKISCCRSTCSPLVFRQWVDQDASRHGEPLNRDVWIFM